MTNTATEQQQPKAASQFEANEFYEQLARERRADATRFRMSYSIQTRQSLEAYERAEARHERGDDALR